MTNEQQQSAPPETDQTLSLTTNRRGFLARSLGAGGSLFALGAVACAPDAGQETTEEAADGGEEAASALPAGKDPASFIQHSELTFETRRAAFGTSAIVPYELLFVRNNLPTPDASYIADRDAWQLTVEGVANARPVTLAELKTLGLESVVTVLQCSGNGRGFFQHDPSGSKWTVGAAGCVAWSGVPVRAVAEALGGPVSGARFVTGTGGEVLPEGVDAKEVIVERSIPLEKGMQDALLAWEMNGQPLPLVHGGPLRLIVPGYYGVNQIKYIKRLAFTPEETDANIMRSGYRIRPIGEGGAPTQPTMWGMDVKSWVNHPGTEASTPAGPVVIDGVAFAGERAVRRVEVSVDGGATWQEAPFVGPDLGPYGWRQFALPVTLAAGTHVIASRATDAAGNTQPEQRVENERGYGNNSWRDHAISVTVA